MRAIVNRIMSYENWGAPAANPTRHFAAEMPPGPDGAAALRRRSAGRTDERDGAYVLSGVLMLLYGLVPIGWVIYGLVVSHMDFGEFLEGLVNPLAHGHSNAVLTPYEWAFAVALVVVGIGLLARRRAARGGALLFGFMLLGLSVREAVGLFDAEYRGAYGEYSEGSWILATRIFGLVVALVVLAAMLKARDRDPALRRASSPAFVAAGVLILLAGLARVTSWIVTYPGDHLDYLRRVFDPSDASPTSISSNVLYYDFALMIALVVVGLIAVLRRRVARGAGLALMPVAGYTAVFVLVPTMEIMPSWDLVWGNADAMLFLGALAFTVLAAVIAVPLLAVASDKRLGGGQPGEDLDATAFAPLPGHVGEQHPGGH